LVTVRTKWFSPCRSKSGRKLAQLLRAHVAAGGLHPQGIHIFVPELDYATISEFLNTFPVYDHNHSPEDYC
jgi:hypothetical protein